MLPGQPHLNTSSKNIIGLFGQPKIPQNVMHNVDVRDVALAHLSAAKMPLEWAGWGKRNLLVGAVCKTKAVVDVLAAADKAKVPDDMRAKLPTEEADELPPHVVGAPPPALTKFDLQRSLGPVADGGLGLAQYRGTKEMIEDTIVSLLANGFTSTDSYDLDK